MINEIKEKLGNPIKLTQNMSISAEKFASLFSDAKELTFNALMSIENDKKYGYEQYIKKWQEDGIIK